MKFIFMHHEPITVTAAIILKDGAILIAQRKKDSWLEPNKWEFPGGKLEPYEQYEQALIREIKEELNIQISIKKFFTEILHTYVKENKEYPVHLLFYLSGWVSGLVKNNDCQDSKWVNISELKNYDFVEADKQIVEKILEIYS